jgi:hypothetical protein
LSDYGILNDFKIFRKDLMSKPNKEKTGRKLKASLPFVILTLIILFQSGCEKDNTPESSIVINELMPKNISWVTDQNGEYDDWIELYNNSSISFDISGYYLSDSKKKISKWKIPSGTTISGNGYLVFWADKDTLQTGLHTNFKLSSDGEKVYFVTPDFLIIDKVEYPATSSQLSYSRKPNGTGSFVWQTPTFNASNN